VREIDTLDKSLWARGFKRRVGISSEHHKRFEL